MSETREIFVVTYRPWGENYGSVLAVFSHEADAQRFAGRSTRREVVTVPLDSQLDPEVGA